jgi:hypothetical protein
LPCFIVDGSVLFVRREKGGFSLSLGERAKTQFPPFVLGKEVGLK